MKHIFKICIHTVLLAALMLSASSCKIKQIRVDSYKIESVVPNGMKSVNTVIGVVIDNPSIYFMVSDIEVKVYRNGIILGNFTADPVVVKGKSFENHHVVGSINLDKGVSVFQLIGYLTKFDASEYVLDIHAKASIKGGGAVNINKIGIPLDELLEKSEKK